MKEAIMNAAAQLIGQYGFRKFTIDEVAETLRISKKTIYRYYKSKDDIINGYIASAVSSDRKDISAALNNDTDATEKIKAVVHAKHVYPLPVRLLNEIKQFYPKQWKEIEELKCFKITALRQICKQGIQENTFRSDINWSVLTKIIEQISDIFTDYSFLIENGLKTTEAIDQALEIILYGIIQRKSSEENIAAYCSES